MPNWVANRLSMDGKDERVQECLDFVRSIDSEGGIRSDFDFNQIIPTTGEADWYSWGIKNWGTKWNATDSYVSDSGDVCFNTAWSPPIPVIRKLAELFPDLIFELEWTIEGNEGRGIEVFNEK
jgi:hypothetical protein